MCISDPVIPHSAEVEEAAAAVRLSKSQLDTLQSRTSELQSQVDEAEAAVNAANARAEQTKGDTIEEVHRLRGI